MLARKTVRLNCWAKEFQEGNKNDTKVLQTQ